MARKAIGFLIDIFYDSYSSTIWAGAIDQAAEQDFSLVTYVVGADNTLYLENFWRKPALAMVNPKQIDGLISLSSVIALFADKEKWMDFFMPFEELPLVSIGQEVSGACNILIDNTKGARDSLFHLIHHHGCQGIAFISGPENNLDAQERFKVYQSVLAENSIPFNKDLVFQGDFTPESGEKAMRELVTSRNVFFDAVVAANDSMALSAIRTLRELRQDVPDKVAVIGFDDSVESRYNDLPLTTVRQPLYQMGRMAVRRLGQMLQGKIRPSLEHLETELIIRRSCGCFQEPKHFDYNKHKGHRETKAHEKLDFLSSEAKFVSKLAGTMEKKLSRVKDKGLMQLWSSQLVDAFHSHFVQKSKHDFLVVLEDVIWAASERGLNNFVWRDVLHSLFLEFLGLFPAAQSEIDLLWRQSVEVIGETAVRSEGFYRLGAKNRDSRLQILNEKLMVINNFNELNTLIIENMGHFNIRSIIIGRYIRQKQKMADSELAIEVAFSNQLDYRDNFHNQIYLLGDVVSTIRAKLAMENSLVAMNLFFGKEQLGFLLIELGPKDGILYEAIKNMVSSAMKSIYLSERAKHYNEILEHEVEKRVIELEEINRMLLEEIVVRERVENELIKEKEFAQITLESIGEGVITTDENSIITQINSVASRLTAWDKEEALGRPLSQVFKAFYGSSNKPVEDFVSSIFSSSEIIKYSSSLILRNNENHEYLIKLFVGPIRNAGKTVGVIISFNDVSHTEKISKQLDYQTSHDTLTGLFNRARFEQILEEAIIYARQDDKPSVLCYIDLLSFRVINDSCGRIAGDEVLRQVGQLLHSQIRTTDSLARLEADHFAILFVSCPLERAKVIAKDLMSAVGNSKFEWNESKFRLEASTGLVALGQLDESPSRIISNALVAADLAKKAGPNQVHVYEPDDKAVLKYNSEISFLPQLTKALEENCFELYCQRIAAVSDKAPNQGHYEVLLRMRDENNKLLSPASFLPVAESYHLMPDIDKWVIKHTFQMVARFIQQGLAVNEVPHLSINLSGKTLSDVTISDFIIDQMNRNNLPPFIFSFEITESEAVSNFNQARHLIRTLKDQGCAFALDDFGKGWASFNYLKFFPIDYLKIDGSFVKGMLDDPLDFVLVETINHTGHVLGLQTVAEYVESEEVYKRLIEIGVNYVQGYYIAKPFPLEQLFLLSSKKE
ncbi:MAG: EAL domain-containing protein [Spirochaetales bacterium]|nr:EAL domain-containing protein [Spirochaetales bacterium]